MFPLVSWLEVVPNRNAHFAQTFAFFIDLFCFLVGVLYKFIYLCCTGNANHGNHC